MSLWESFRFGGLMFVDKTNQCQNIIVTVGIQNQSEADTANETLIDNNYRLALRI